MKRILPLLLLVALLAGCQQPDPKQTPAKPQQQASSTTVNNYGPYNPPYVAPPKPQEYTLPSGPLSEVRGDGEIVKADPVGSSMYYVSFVAQTRQGPGSGLTAGSLFVDSPEVGKMIWVENRYMQPTPGVYQWSFRFPIIQLARAFDDEAGYTQAKGRGSAALLQWVRVKAKNVGFFYTEGGQ